MKKLYCITFIVISMILLTAFYSVSFAADADTPITGDKLDIKDIVEQVDVLQIVTDMNLKLDQLSFIVARIDFLSQKHDELQKKEKSLQLEIKEPLVVMRNAFIAGKDIPAEARNAAYAKLQPIKQTRQDMQTAFNDAANSCVDMLDDGQRRVLGRTADVLSRAQRMIQEIQSASENDWPKTMASLAAEIIKVKESDRYNDWQTQVDNVKNLPASEREQAYQNLESSRKAELDQMQTDAEQLLQSVRSANRQVLPIALNKLAGALKSQTELHNQLFNAFSRVLDSPGAPAALKARIEVMKAAAEKKTGK